MIRWWELLLYGGALVFSFFLHVGLLQGLSAAAHNAPHERARVLEFAVLEPPPPPPPEVEPPALDPPEVDLTKVEMPSEVEPPSNTTAEPEQSEPARPVFGVSLSSTVGPGTGTGFSVRVGNTLMKDPDEEFTPPDQVKPLEPVPLFKVNRPPRFKGSKPCKPKDYPPDGRAKRMGIEGRVELEVEIRFDGTVGEVKVVKGLGYGLDEAAVAAVKKCPFEPAQMAGRPVTTRIPFGVNFVIEY